MYFAIKIIRVTVKQKENQRLSNFIYILIEEVEKNLPVLKLIFNIYFKININISV